jgi:hypothetical protein
MCCTSDPHFKTFNDQYFSFHGECDLVLMNSRGFSSRLGVRVHARTKRVDNSNPSYSFISSVAVQVGSDVLEVLQNGNLFINGNLNVDEMSPFGGYFLKRSYSGPKKRIVVYSLDLHGGKVITIHANTIAGMVFVDIDGHFEDSEGLLGPSSGKGNSLFSRDGLVDLSGHWNTYAEDWQVRETEPKLFKDKDRAPQYPVGCRYGSIQNQSIRHRRLIDDAIGIEDANEVCEEVTDEMRDFCVFDVIAVGDKKVAEDPFYSKKPTIAL